MSTLISTLMQDYRGLDLFFIYQKGDGSCLNKASYNEYREIVKECGVNLQLSEGDPRVREICRIKGYKAIELEFENDQALDSGAWYKFIKTGLWQDYDYIFFIQEGTIFTRPTSISSAINFALKNKAHFISAGHEKQCMPKDIFLITNRRNPEPSNLHIFHDRMIDETFRVFRRDNDFESLYGNWESGFPMETQNHIPDLGGGFWFLSNLRNKVYENIYRLHTGRVISLDIFKSIIHKFDFFLKGYENFLLSNSINHNYNHSQREPRLVINTKIYDLKRTVNFIEEEGVKFHLANDNQKQWFGCSCQHLLSRQFLERLHAKLDKYKIYDVLDVPFAGSALEVIWGFFPDWLGYDKWFFDGVHRVRKNFFTYEREDNQQGMARWLNWYYRGLLYVQAEGDFIKIRKTGSDLSHLKAHLTQHYF